MKNTFGLLLSASLLLCLAGCQKTPLPSLYYEPQAIDLGLSVKWASVNLGAYNPQDYGFYYQWGDVIGYGPDSRDGKYFADKDKEGNSTYKWWDGNKMTKYVPEGTSNYTDCDNLRRLLPEDDAATVNLGKKWRMPTREEIEELIDPAKCSWKWLRTADGINGFKVQSLVPGYTDNWIFLPAGGSRSGDSEATSDGSWGAYFAADLFNCYLPNRLRISSNYGPEIASITARGSGSMVRPVMDK